MSDLVENPEDRFSHNEAHLCGRQQWGKISLCICAVWSTPLEPRCEKTCLLGFGPCPTQTGLFNHRIWLEAWYFVFRKQGNRTSYVAKTKALISFAVTAKLICVFVFTYAESQFSHDEAYMWMTRMRQNQVCAFAQSDQYLVVCCCQGYFD